MPNSSAESATKKAITLKLDEEEAAALVDILYCVGGSPGKSPRSHASSVLYALERAGVKHRIGRVDGSLYFRDYDGSQPSMGLLTGDLLNSF